jgi:hypothetical protein
MSKLLRNALSTAARAGSKGYSAVSTPLSTRIANKLPEQFQPAAKSFLRTTGVGATGAGVYSAYDDAGTAFGDAASNAAAATGIKDQQVLDDVAQRGKAQMLPLAYKAVAPKWLGGDGTQMGRQIANTLGTVAYHNVGPSLLRPSPAAAQAPAGVKAFKAVMGNPLSTVASAVLSPRPDVAQLWRNTPMAAKKQLAQTALSAGFNPDPNSGIAQGIHNIFQPAVNYHKNRLQNFGRQVGTGVAQLPAGPNMLAKR